jgi:hypothetical protein
MLNGGFLIFTLQKTKFIEKSFIPCHTNILLNHKLNNKIIIMELDVLVHPIGEPEYPTTHLEIPDFDHALYL